MTLRECLKRLIEDRNDAAMQGYFATVHFMDRDIRELRRRIKREGGSTIVAKLAA